MPDAPPLVVLSAGAAKGVVEALQPGFRDETGADVSGTFGAVGAIREKFVANDACDILILTAVMLEELAGEGRVDRATIAPLGRVLTGIAVRSGEPHPAIGSPSALRACLAQARSLYCPDPERATAGIHFVKVLRELGLWPDCAPRLAAYPSGAIAMRALADTTGPGAVGCTQVTEILYTPGVDLVGPLPAEFTLATMYSVAVGTRAPQPALARRFAALIAGTATQKLRERGGFVAAPDC
jgi:molybdate transport system substrate-binding protein